MRLIPKVIHNDLPRLDDDTLCNIAEIIDVLQHQATEEEEALSWGLVLHALEIERYSRGM